MAWSFAALSFRLEPHSLDWVGLSAIIQTVDTFDNALRRFVYSFFRAALDIALISHRLVSLSVLGV